MWGYPPHHPLVSVHVNFLFIYASSLPSWHESSQKRGVLVGFLASPLHLGQVLVMGRIWEVGIDGWIASRHGGCLWESRVEEVWGALRYNEKILDVSNCSCKKKCTNWICLNAGGQGGKFHSYLTSHRTIWAATHSFCTFQLMPDRNLT